MLTGAMVQWTLRFFEIIGYPYYVSSLRLNKGGIMDMLLVSFPINYHLYGFASCDLHSVFCASPLAFSNSLRFGIFVAVQTYAGIVKGISPSLGSGYG